MSKTANFGLTLMTAGQAQKHVTVNDAFERLDALAMLSVESRVLATPPVSPVDGEKYIIPVGATGDWAGYGGQIALGSNGGWIVIEPQNGWRSWVVDEARDYVYQSGIWEAQAIAAGTVLPQIEAVSFDHLILAGSSNTTIGEIASGSLVLGVSARVIDPITGASGWRFGVAGATDRYGDALGTSLNSFTNGQSGTPLYYTNNTALELTAIGGNFSGGQVRFTIYRLNLPPAAEV